MQTIITLACKECRSRNYTTTKNRTNVRGKLSLRKHCPRCGKHTVHDETR